MKTNYFLKLVQKKRLSFAFYFGVLFLTLNTLVNAQQTYTFTNCGATGSVGPTQTMVNNSYSLTNLGGSVGTTSTGIQTWTVPFTGNFRIEARGAQGGTSTSSGGFGACMAGDFALNAGEVLQILVGQQGEHGTTGISPGGGGGASFVVRTPYTTTTSILLVAGGGTGGGAYTDNPGLTTTAGGTGGVAGGSNGTGGLGGTRGAGGGGFLTDGGPCGTATYANPGQAFINGGRGGDKPNNTTCTSTFGSVICAGGFGGGSSHGGNCFLNGGAGGGFSGGGGSSNTSSGGGGSLNSGTSQSNTASCNTGNGRVTITELCNISLSSSASGPVNNVALCSGQSLTLTTNAVSNYSWSNNSTASSIVITPTVTTSYSLTATSSLNCTASRVVLVTVSAGIPTLSINTSTNTICLGQAVTFTASGASTYTWSNGINNAVAFTPTASGSFSVIGQNGCGTSTAATAVTIAPLPVSLASSHSVVCAGSTSTLSAIAAANSYTWLPINSSNSFIVVSPQVSTNYTVVVSNGTCIGTNTIDVNALPVPTIVASPSLTSVCEGVPVNLTASGGLSYTWTPVNLNGSSITVTPSIPTPYQVVGSNSLGCTSSANAIVIIDPSPTLSLIASNNLICAEDPVNISVSGASSYSWNTGSNTNSINITPTVTTIYSVIGELNGCTSTETVIISVFIPTLAITGNTSICVGESSTLTASSANTYSWSSGFNTAAIQITPTSNTLYVVSALTSSSGINCPSSASVQINVKPLPNLTVSATSTNLCKGETTTLSVSGASTYTWSTVSNASFVTITPSLISTFNYSVSGTNAQNCVNSASISLKVNACIGLDEKTIANSILSIYPNPNNGSFTINSNETLEVKLMDELGQTIRITELNDTNNFADNVFDLPSGIFFVIGHNQNHTIVTKIIIAK